MGTWEHDSEYHWHPSTCGHDVTTPPVAHAFSKNVTEATYSSGGYTTYTCDVCGFCYTADRTDPVELKYTIIFDLNGGSSASYVSSKEVKTLSASDFFFDCRKSGYNFRGWSYNGIKVFDENGKQLFTPNMELTMTFVAVFANDASMSIWSNMTEAGTVSGSGYYEYNTDVNVSATPYQGYAFVGWYDEDGILLSSQTSYKYRMSESDIVIEARFKLADFDLKIESNSFDLGTVFINPVSSTSTSRYEVSKQSSITYTNNVKIAAYTKTEDIRFLGWFDEGDELVSTNAVYSFTMPNHDYYLQAKWNSFSVSYETNGGVNSDANPESVSTEDEVSLSSPTRDGYDFAGWYDKASDEKVDRISVGTLKDIDLYAKWTPTQYKINYELGTNGQNASGNPSEYNIEQSVSLSDPTRPGYKFEGWYSDSSFKKACSSISAGSMGEKTFYAKWTAIGYTITYNLNGGINSDNPEAFTVEDSFSLKAPSRTGYEFKGWYLDSSYSTKVDSINAGTIGDISLYAKWQAIEYKITYDLNGGNAVSNRTTYTVEDSFSLKSPTRTGYSFSGWYSGSTKVSSISKGTTGNLSLAARWTAVSYKITYNLSGGTNNSGNPGSYTIESPAISLSDPTRKGYTFEGWYSDSSFKTEKSSIPAGSTGNVAFYAKWAAVQHNLSVSSSDASKGTASIDSGSGYTDESVTVSASPIGDYAFKGWYSGDEFVSKANPYTFSMPAQNYSLAALFWTKAEEEEEEERRRGLGMAPVLSEDGKSLTYGLYPQTHVSEETEKPTVDSLNALAAAEAEGNGWYLLDGEYYAKATANPYGSGYEFDDGTAISSGTVYWFRCEPIKWDILKTEEGSYFLLSDKLLDAYCYNEFYLDTKDGYYANDYGNSEIRAWLNGAFYNSAFALDSSLVMETEVDNSASTTCSSSNSYACESTDDKVFLPSYQDYKNADYGFSTSYSDYDVARQCKTTDWARANYAWCSTSFSYYNNGYYWTRSPNPSDSYYASCVNCDGSLGSGHSVDNSVGAVRPCLKLRRTA